MTLTSCPYTVYGMQHMGDAQGAPVNPPSREGTGGLVPLDQYPESLTQLVYGAIRDAIVTKALAPGTTVSEANLARRLRVSKTPVREALLRLQAVGLVESSEGRSSRVVLPSYDAIRSAFEVRLVLEAAIARMAAERASAEQRAQLTAASRNSLACAEQADIDGFRRWDLEFHHTASLAAGNARLAELAENARVLTSVLRDRDVPAVGDAIKCSHQHVVIADAIASFEQDLAAGAAEEHVRDVQQLVISAFSLRTEPTANVDAPRTRSSSAGSTGRVHDGSVSRSHT